MLLAGGLSAVAQKQKINYMTTFDDKWVHFGFTVGLNTLDFTIVNYPSLEDAGITESDFGYAPKPSEGYIYSDVARLTPGFTVGIVSSLRISRDLNLRFVPGLSFGERQITFNIPAYDINTSAGGGAFEYFSIKSTFLDFPLLIKYKARRINNNRPYVIFGGSYRHDISRTAQEDLVKLKSSGFYAEVGGGWDHYFPFFRWSVEAKFSFGLNDQLGDLPIGSQSKVYAKSIKELRSKIFTLCFHFE